MKRILGALLGALLATTAWAQGGYGGGTGPQYTWPKDNFLLGLMNGTGTSTFNGNTTFSLTPDNQKWLQLGTKAPNATDGFKIYQDRPYADPNNMFSLNFKYNGFWRGYFLSNASTTSNTVTGWGFGNVGTTYITACDRPRSETDTREGVYYCGFEQSNVNATRTHTQLTVDGQNGNGISFSTFTGNTSTYANYDKFSFAGTSGSMTMQLQNYTNISAAGSNISFQMAGGNIQSVGQYRNASGTIVGSTNLQTNAFGGSFSWSRTKSGQGTGSLTMSSALVASFSNGPITFNSTGLLGGFVASVYPPTYQYKDIQDETKRIKLYGAVYSQALQRKQVVMCDNPEYLGCNPYYPTGTASNSVADSLSIEIVDTTPSITAGNLRVCGQTIDDNGGTYDVALERTWACEVVDISGGAGTYTTSNQWTLINSLFVEGVSTLGGAGDETVALDWATGAQAHTTGFSPTVQPDPNDLVIFADGGSVNCTYTLVAAVAANGQVKIGADAAETFEHLTCAVNDDGVTCTEGAGNDYMATAECSGVSWSIGDGFFQADDPGAAGNNIWLYSYPTGASTFLTSQQFTGGAGGEVLAASALTNTSAPAPFTNGVPDVNFVHVYCLNAECEWDLGAGSVGGEALGRELVVMVPSGVSTGPVTINSTTVKLLEPAILEQGDLIKFIRDTDISTIAASVPGTYLWVEQSRNFRGVITSALVDNTATAFAVLAIPQTAGENYADAQINYVVFCTDETNQAVQRGTVKVACHNLAGTEACGFGTPDGVTLGDGTASIGSPTFTATYGTDDATLKLQSDCTGVTPSTLTVEATFDQVKKHRAITAP